MAEEASPWLPHTPGRLGVPGLPVTRLLCLMANYQAHIALSCTSEPGNPGAARCSQIPSDSLGVCALGSVSRRNAKGQRSNGLSQMTGWEHHSLPPASWLQRSSNPAFTWGPLASRCYVCMLDKQSWGRGCWEWGLALHGQCRAAGSMLIRSPLTVPWNVLFKVAAP